MKKIFLIVMLLSSMCFVNAQIRMYSVTDVNQDNDVDIADINRVVEKMTGHNVTEQKVINVDDISSLLMSLESRITCLEQKQVKQDSIINALRSHIAMLDSLHGINNSNDTSSVILPDVVIGEETYYNTKEQLMAMLAGLYTSLRSFEQGVQIMEGMAMGVFDVNDYRYRITPYNQYIENTWTSGYVVTNKCNMYIKYSSQVLNSDPSLTATEYQSFMQQVLCIRSIVYYQMAMLWGNVPYLTETIEDGSLSIRQTSQDIILNDCYQICRNNSYSLNGLWGDEYRQYTLSNNNIRPLIWEMGYAIGNYECSTDCVRESFYIRRDQDDDYSSHIVMVTPDYYQRLIDEQSADKSILASRWIEAYPSYGVWNALKRLGNTSYNSQLAPTKLFPIPQRELDLNNLMVQNEGYSTVITR